MAKQPLTSKWRGELVECKMQRGMWLSRGWCFRNHSKKLCAGCPVFDIYEKLRIEQQNEEKQNEMPTV